MQYLVFFTMSSIAFFSVHLSIHAYLWYIREQLEDENDPVSLILAQSYVFSWFLTLIGALLLVSMGLGGTYIFTFWNVSLFISVLLDGD